MSDTALTPASSKRPGIAAGHSWLTYIGVGYVLLALFVTFNLVLVAWGSPAVGITSWVTQEGRLAGAGGLEVLTWFGLLVIVLGVVRGGFSRRQWQLVAAVAAWIGSTAISMTLHGELRDTRFWYVAVASVAVAVAGAMIPFSVLKRLMVALGWFFGWGSTLVGLSDLIFGWPTVLIGDPRYERWLSVVGIDSGPLASLNGVTPGRVYVGLTCAVLLVFAVRAVPGKWTWAMSAGLVIATLWSFSRTGVVAVVVGLLVALVPVERIPRAFGWTLTALLAVILLPLVLSGWLQTTPVTDGTTTWRLALWQNHLSDPQVWMPFGVGPKSYVPGVADHAHQQFLESLVVGGWLGLAGCVAFVVLAARVAVLVAGLDNRATLGVVFVMGAIFQIDVVTFTATYSVLNNAFVLIVAVVISAAGLADRSP